MVLIMAEEVFSESARARFFTLPCDGLPSPHPQRSKMPDGGIVMCSSDGIIPPHQCQHHLFNPSIFVAPGCCNPSLGLIGLLARNQAQ